MHIMSKERFEFTWHGTKYIVGTSYQFLGGPRLMSFNDLRKDFEPVSDTPYMRNLERAALAFFKNGTDMNIKLYLIKLGL